MTANKTARLPYEKSRNGKPFFFVGVLKKYSDLFRNHNFGGETRIIFEFFKEIYCNFALNWVE